MSDLGKGMWHVKVNGWEMGIDLIKHFSFIIVINIPHGKDATLK